MTFQRVSLLHLCRLDQRVTSTVHQPRRFLFVDCGRRRYRFLSSGKQHGIVDIGMVVHDGFSSSDAVSLDFEAPLIACDSQGVHAYIMRAAIATAEVYETV